MLCFDLFFWANLVDTRIIMTILMSMTTLNVVNIWFGYEEGNAIFKCEMKMASFPKEATVIGARLIVLLMILLMAWVMRS